VLCVRDTNHDHVRTFRAVSMSFSAYFLRVFSSERRRIVWLLVSQPVTITLDEVVTTSSLARPSELTECRHLYSRSLVEPCLTLTRFFCLQTKITYTVI
jgi:hypothetical protein